MGMVLMAYQSIIAQNTEPSINPTATYLTADGEEENNDYSGSAPLQATFKANPSNHEGWTGYYEWRFTLDGQDTPYLVRYEQDTQLTFTQSGSHTVVLYATFTKGDDKVEYAEEYWRQVPPLRVSISESKLEMPNAFSPNGDGINDIYKAKDGFQSLTEFKATVFNRWGQKIFEWDNPADGWDGKYKGTDVKSGVYYVVVKAKGADGKVYNIRRDVNLLREYINEGTQSNP